MSIKLLLALFVLLLEQVYEYSPQLGQANEYFLRGQVFHVRE